ncbi:L-gulonolactone oxidase-like [Schistocerca gregaria]|uniref:L-gulonolactone oxidase-like n=1 Tax=Schistocerca gregaria TaxID=7010 RepID=UPI00211E4832|nr:L-gulonolactone oxidase-like [Schistocerca gregaria]
MRNYNAILNIDKKKNLVTCQAGCTLDKLNQRLKSEKFGLRVLGSISHQTVAGAICTPTHGTGIQYGILATEVVHIQFVNGNCDVIECSEIENQNIFKACLCSFGSLGIITEITMRVEPLKTLVSLQFPLKLRQVEENLTRIIYGAEHSRIWWFPHTDKCSIWQANKLEFNASDIEKSGLNSQISCGKKKFSNFILESVLYLSTIVPSVTPYVNKVSHKVLFGKVVQSQDVSFKEFNIDCLFKQYVNEWAIPIEHALEALSLLQLLITEHNINANWPVEVRFVRNDDIWLSPCYGESDRCFIGIIMYRPYSREPKYLLYFKKFDEMMSSLGGRPHWAKAHGWKYKECKESYPMWEEFCKLRSKMDPKNVFMNEYTRSIFNP